MIVLKLLVDPNGLEIDCPHCKGLGTVILTANDLAKEIYKKKRWYYLFLDLGENQELWAEGERECFGSKDKLLKALERRQLIEIADTSKIFPIVTMTKLGKKVFKILADK